MTDKACFFILFDDLFEKINEIEELANKYNAKFLETSAKDNINVDELFTTLITDLSDNYEPEPLNDSTKLDKSSFSKDNKEGGCRC